MFNEHRDFNLKKKKNNDKIVFVLRTCYIGYTRTIMNRVLAWYQRTFIALTSLIQTELTASGKIM